MSDGGENKRGRDLQDVIVPCRGVGTVSWQKKKIEAWDRKMS
jgi:hypothetical protein